MTKQVFVISVVIKSIDVIKICFHLYLLIIITLKISKLHYYCDKDECCSIFIAIFQHG